MDFRLFGLLFLSLFQAESGDGVSLVLSGGGARGFAHVGVLMALEEENVAVRSVTGASMGSLIGGLYCCGYSPAFLDSLVRETSWEHLFSSEPDRKLTMLPLRLSDSHDILRLRLRGFSPILPRSAVSTQRVGSLLTSLTGPVQVSRGLEFDSLPIPLRIVAFDLVSHCRIILSSGNLAASQLSSMAVPAVFPAVGMGDMLLVDGGVGDNLPVDAARETWDYPVLAVDISSDLPDIPDSPSLLQVGSLTYSALSQRVNSLYSDEPDFYFRPDLQDFKSYEFSNEAADSLVSLGYTQMLQYLRQHPEIPRDSCRLIAQEHVESVVLQSIEFSGLEDVSMGAVLDWLPVRAGDTVSPENLREAAEKLYASGLFQRVDYELRPADSSGMVELEYTLFEMEPSMVGIGLTYNNQFGMDARFTYSHLNFLNAGDHLIVNFGGGDRYIFGEMRVLDLSSGRRKWFADYSLTAWQMKSRFFERDGSSGLCVETRACASAARGFSSGWSGLVEVGLSGKVHRYGSSDYQGFPFLFLSHQIETIDDPILPGSGMRLRTVLSWAPLQNRRHASLEVDFEAALPFLRKGTLQFSSWGQLLWGRTWDWQEARFNASRILPGMPWNSHPSRQRFASTIRFRRNLNGPFFLSLQAGGSWDWESPLEPADGEFLYGAGISAGLSTPMGPAAISWGWSSIYHGRWTVSVGSSQTYGPGR